MIQYILYSSDIFQKYCQCLGGSRVSEKKYLYIRLKVHFSTCTKSVIQNYCTALLYSLYFQ